MILLQHYYMRLLRWLRGERGLCYECRGHRVSWDQICGTCDGTGEA